MRDLRGSLQCASVNDSRIQLLFSEAGDADLCSMCAWLAGRTIANSITLPHRRVLPVVLPCCTRRVLPRTDDKSFDVKTGVENTLDLCVRQKSMQTIGLGETVDATRSTQIDIAFPVIDRLDGSGDDDLLRS